jgi:hypothetical protein
VQTEIGAKQGFETAGIPGTSLAMKCFTLDHVPHASARIPDQPDGSHTTLWWIPDQALPKKLLLLAD